MTTIIDLLRHGEPVGGRAYRGNRIDDPLSELGWHQMRSILTGEVPWQRIVTSPMTRCRDFAQEVAVKYDLPVTIEHDLREVGFGDWEGKTPEEILATEPEQYHAFYEDPVANRPAGAEELELFFRRATQTFTRLADQFREQHLLLVTHAGIIRAIVTGVLEAPLASMYRLKIDYAGLCRIHHDGNRARLDCFNSSTIRDRK